jgi:hypothetical protein
MSEVTNSKLSNQSPANDSPIARQERKMAGLDKRVASYEAALEGLTDGMTLLPAVLACAAFPRI